MSKGDVPEATNIITGQIVDAAIVVHKEMGPGLLESIYESCLVREFHKRNLDFQRQKAIPVAYQGEPLEEMFRLDLLVGNKVIVEVKAVENLLPIHEAQLMTYLRLTGCAVGLLLNFNVRFMKDGIQRVVLTGK
jgi:GxxExxY protein